MNNSVAISLREINESNWRECIALSVKEDQKRFIGTNENGLALAYAHKEMQPRGIYANEVMAGFIMYAKDPDDGLYYINRFMIDESYQGKGYGRRALELLTEQLKADGVASVDILHKPDNEQAIRLYMSLGFEQTDERVDYDVISRLEMRV
jgi:diamine N-acetyltransferase